MALRDEDEYEDLLGQWSDLESGLGVLLASPASAQEFTRRLVQYDRWMQSLMRRDADAGLYLLFQLAANSPVGYSASHALVCAVLCHLMAAELNFSAPERDSLVCAALTMNIGMTRLQDALANQVEKPTPEQMQAIKTHSHSGATLLQSLGVQDRPTLEIVASHHSAAVEKADPRTAAITERLAQVLQTVDRYAAMISPRVSRAGRSASDSARSIMGRVSQRSDAIGHTLVQVVGLYPPGTYVRLDDGTLAVVVRRSAQAKHPLVAVVGQGDGERLEAPRLHATDKHAPHIRSALPPTTAGVRLNHSYILQLGMLAAQTVQV